MKTIAKKTTKTTGMCSESANFRQGQKLKQKLSGIGIRISELIRIRMCAGLLPKCYGFIPTTIRERMHNGVSVFAKYRRKSAGDCMRDANKYPKIPYSERWGKWKSDPESVSGTGSPSQVNQFFRLVGPSKSEMKSTDYFFSNPAHGYTCRQTNLTDHVTSLAEVTK